MKVSLGIVVSLFLILGIARPAFADLSASPIIMIFNGDAEKRQDITVSNSGKYVKYLEVSAHRILNPGEHPENLENESDPAKVGLLVAPRRLVLKPGEQKVIRVIRIGPAANKDKAWRVHIRPAKSEIEADRSAIMTQLAYKALVIARPSEATASMEAMRSGKSLTIKNTGNSNILLHSGKQCALEDGTTCNKITAKRIWPGASWSQELPYDTPVEFQTLGPSGEGTANF